MTYNRFTGSQRIGKLSLMPAQRPALPGKEWLGIFYTQFRVFAWPQFIPLWSRLTKPTAVPFAGGVYIRVTNILGLPGQGNFSAKARPVLDKPQ